MTDVSIASSDADATAAAAVEAHHTAMSGALSGHVERLVTAATAGGDAGPTRTELVSWCRRELVPHALAEEKTMYPAAHARPEGRLLVTGMLGEHTVITADLGLGRGKATVWTCDLTKAYVEINGDYRS